MYRITGCKPGMWSFFILSAFISPCAQSISDKKTRTALRFPLLPLEYRLVINIFFCIFSLWNQYPHQNIFRSYSCSLAWAGVIRICMSQNYSLGRFRATT